MKRIKLFGALSVELKDLKLKPGMKFWAKPAEIGRNGVVEIVVDHDGEKKIAHVWPENYKETWF